MEKIKQIWTNIDLRNKIIFTLLMLAVFRVGSNIPVPGINRETLDQLFNNDNMGLFELYNLFSGGSFSNFTIFALGVTPYITASIIVQLFTIAFPYFENLSKSGEEGRKKMSSITRYLTVGLSLVQGAGMAFGLFRRAIVDQSVYTSIVIVFMLTAGTAFLMWLGEQINEYGVGNGMSLLIFAGIVARVPTDVASVVNSVKQGQTSYVTATLYVAFAVLVIAGVVLVQRGERRVPIQYAKKVIGRRTYGGQSTYIPIKVNHAGVIPIIFSIAILLFPITIASFMPESGFALFCNKYLSSNGNPGVWIYSILNVILIFFFTYFYTAIVFKPDEVSKNLREGGGFIPGIRPGMPTRNYLADTMSKLCFAGAIFLAVIDTLPVCVSHLTPLDIRFGGTSLLILVGVAFDTWQQIESRMVMNKHKGFL